MKVSLSNIEINNDVEAKVNSINDTGINLLIKDKYDGFITLSEMTWLKKPPHPSKIVSLNDIVKVKIDSFDGSVHDADDVDLQGFIDANFPGTTLVAATVKAGNNQSGMGPGEGELFILDASVDLSDLEAAGKPNGSADYEFDYASDLAPLGGPDAQPNVELPDDSAGGDDVIDGGEGDDIVQAVAGAADDLQPHPSQRGVLY